MAKKYGTTTLSGAEKEKRTPKFLRNIFESPKKKAERLSTASGKANTAASKKMYAAESMFSTAKKAEKAIAAAKRDKAKTRIGPVTPMTARDRAKVKSAPKGTFKKANKLDADTRKSYEKRIAYMEKRKAAGKNYSKKNLADLKAKLK